MNPFFLLLDQIRKPSEATLWLTSDHVTKLLDDMREEERLQKLADNESVYQMGTQL